MRIIGNGVRIVAGDLPKLTAFYESALGLRLFLGGDDYSIFDDGVGGLIELDASVAAADQAGTPRVVATFFVDAIDEVWERIHGAGCKPGAVVDEGYRRRFEIVDPEHNVLWFVQNAVDVRHKHAAGEEADALRPFLDHLGLQWSFVGDVATLSLALRPDLTGPGGALQGGVTASLIDVAAATCAATALGGARVYTSTMTVHYLRPGRVGPIRASATPLHVTRTNASVEVHVVDTGSSDDPIAIGLVHLQVRGDEQPKPTLADSANDAARLNDVDDHQSGTGTTLPMVPPANNHGAHAEDGVATALSLGEFVHREVWT